MKPQRRIYKKGRSTEGWRRGERIRRLAQLRKGTRIICVSDQFKTENLAVVTNRHPHRDIGLKDDDIVYAAWAKGRAGRRTGEREFAIWYWEFSDATGLRIAGRFYIAERAP